MLEAVELPASIADLASGLAHVDGDTLTLKKESCLLQSFSFLLAWIRIIVTYTWYQFILWIGTI